MSLEIFASNQGLAFDLDKLKKLREDTEKVCEELTNQKNDLKKGLDVLRTDWRTPAGDYFFENLDKDWESEIVKFENTIALFEKILKDAIEEFGEVVAEAEKVSLDTI